LKGHHLDFPLRHLDEKKENWPIEENGRDSPPTLHPLTENGNILGGRGRSLEEGIDSFQKKEFTQ